MSKLQPGDLAPLFTADNLFDEPVDLATMKGRMVMLSFYRYASCPLCNLRINDLICQFDTLHASGLEMIAVFQSPKASILQYVGKQDAPFDIIPDPNQQLYELYKVNGNWAKFIKGLKPGKLFSAAKNGFLPGKIETDISMIPADFLIDQNGEINTAYYGKDSADHLSLESISKFLKSAV